MGEEELERSELEALLETRRELGASYDAALVDSFADRIERAVERRYGAEVGARAAADRVRDSAGRRQTALGISSVAMGIPISAIALGAGDSGFTGFASLVVAWAGIVGVNAAHALQGRGWRQ
ncbi:hypothetical protein ACFP3Q_03715 [Nocardioides sp. GCM10027113]|uniref:hypothetical protein n=1 Tax=unclassified Nocardioides TaxID=2615069 RepID=UPI00360B7B75